MAMQTWIPFWKDAWRYGYARRRQFAWKWDLIFAWAYFGNALTEFNFFSNKTSISVDCLRLVSAQSNYSGSSYSKNKLYHFFVFNAESVELKRLRLNAWWQRMREPRNFKLETTKVQLICYIPAKFQQNWLRGSEMVAIWNSLIKRAITYWTT